MTGVDVHTMTVRELLETSVAVTGELRARGYARTGTSLAGELLELVVARSYGARLEAPANAGWDAVTPDGTRIQVKTRFLEPGVRRAFTFSSLDFDVVVLVRLDATTFTIDWARWVTSDELEPLLTAHGTAGHRLPAGRAAHAGHDVTAALRNTLDALT